MPVGEYKTFKECIAVEKRKLKNTKPNISDKEATTQAQKICGAIERNMQRSKSGLDPKWSKKVNE